MTATADISFQFYCKAHAFVCLFLFFQEFVEAFGCHCCSSSPVGPEGEVALESSSTTINRDKRIVQIGET